ncbi:hypothetical protein [Caballeronia sp. LZ032]|uniref:hypothetical protein n=1 Tax=Caballeronia sp. LZ032 TaxID=3038565 RepID=UPI002867385E|nr:hypothetical protein [Caballeronia sp. LZ032]MDR5878316.1 hypothetical protein [Caballeronia sp. LZ032]
MRHSMTTPRPAFLLMRTVRACVALAAPAAFAAGLCWFSPVQAKAGGEPLVLDTQTGIHSGASGTVLQSGALGGPGMVPMQTLQGPPQEAQPPIVVSPYVEYPGAGQSSVPTQPGRGGRSRAPVAPHP